MGRANLSGEYQMSRNEIKEKENQPRIKFGIRLLGSLGHVSYLQRLGAIAERAGFDSCWFAHDPFQPNSWVSAVAVAAVTKRIAIGYNVKPYTIDPSEVATFAASLDEFSNGRVILGIGSHTDTMYDWLGLSSTSLIDLTRESVNVIRGLLSGSIVKHEGKIFHWTEQCYLRFSPIRRDIPIFVPGFGKDMFRLSGEIGNGTLPMATPPESIDYPIKYIKEGAEIAGRDYSTVDVVGLIWMYVSKDGAVDKKSLKRVISYFLPYLEHEMISRAGVSKMEVENVRKKILARDYEGASAAVSDKSVDLAVYGTPEDCIKRIESMVKKGATSVSIGGPLGVNPEEAIRVIGEEIIPYFKEKKG